MVSEDIDLVSMGHPEKSKEVLQNDLFQFALKNFQMGPEFISLAVEFFLKDLPGWEAAQKSAKILSLGKK